MTRRKKLDQSIPTGDPMVATFQARIHDCGAVERGNGNGALSAYADRYGTL